jgi:hypothetical protein
MQTITIAAGNTEFVDLSQAGKVMIYIPGTQNVEIAYNQQDFAGGSFVFTLLAGIQYVFDEPNPFPEAMYLRCPENEDASFQFWTMGGGYQ